MPSELRKGLPSFWSTGLAKVLVGDQPCNLALWLAGHTELQKRSRDDQASLTAWKAAHTSALDALEKECRAAGWAVRKEQFFRVKGEKAIVSGKADLITQSEGRRPTIWDVKSGQPRESDSAQVLLEMVLIPIAWGAPSMQFAGVVVYPTHRVELTPSDAAAFRPKLFAKIRELASPERPAAAPSRDACRFCDVTDADCAQRFRETPDAVTTEF